MLRPFLSAALGCLLLVLSAPLVRAEDTPASLHVRNHTHMELLSIRFSTTRVESFARLDLPPDGEDTLERPGGVQDLRLDFGLVLWNFPHIDLDRLQGITACREHDAPCLLLHGSRGEETHCAGTVRSLLPADGRPVCALTSFRPGMKMDDACALLEKNLLTDENGAVLTSLGFAGLVWAARLTPGQGPVRSAVLEHLELRQTLTTDHLRALLSTLYAQGYSLWQAEFPGMDFNFTEMTTFDEERRRQILQQGVELMFSAGTGEASIMLAPRALLPALLDAEDPKEDVQLFTVTLRPASSTLLVDIASYTAELQDEGER